MAAAGYLFAHVVVLTWRVEPIPLHAALPGIYDFYRNRGAELASRLSETAMIPATPIFALAAVSSLLALGLAVRIAVSLRRG
jgi:hypothetical protein